MLRSTSSHGGTPELATSDRWNRCTQAGGAGPPTRAATRSRAAAAAAFACSQGAALEWAARASRAASSQLLTSPPEGAARTRHRSAGPFARARVPTLARDGAPAGP